MKSMFKCCTQKQHWHLCGPKDSCNLSNGKLQMETVDKLIMLKSSEFPRCDVAVFLSGLGFWVLGRCPERHAVVWWNVGLG